MRSVFAAVAFVLCVTTSVMAQPWEGYYGATPTVQDDHQVLVLNPEGEGQERYKFLSLPDLMAPVYTFPDTLVRYAAIKAGPRSSVADTSQYVYFLPQAQPPTP